jgi:hypothetical protein
MIETMIGVVRLPGNPPTMLVDDDRSGPLQSLADIDHRPGQADRFVRIERDRRAGRDECREMDIAIASLGDVGDDR